MNNTADIVSYVEDFKIEDPPKDGLKIGYGMFKLFLARKLEQIKKAVSYDTAQNETVSVFEGENILGNDLGFNYGKGTQ